MIQLDDMVPLADAAQLAGVTAHTLKQQAQRGRLRARKIAGRWLTTRQWIEEYLDVHARKNARGRKDEARKRQPARPAGSGAEEGAERDAR